MSNKYNLNFFQRLWLNTFTNWKNLTMMEPVCNTTSVVFNPYPHLGCPLNSCWPRGFPLDQVLHPETNTAAVDWKASSAAKIGVLQSLADHEPGELVWLFQRFSK